MTRGGGRFPARLNAPAAVPAKARPGEPLRPQRVAEAARPRPGTTAPAGGLGLDSEAVRRRMVEQLRARGLQSGRVAEAMLAVPRHLFVDSALAGQAYEDTSLPIGHSQTISKPSVVARMIEALDDGISARARGHLGRVLEIGTGCGYQAAVLARLAQQVYSIERLKPLHDRARIHLDMIGVRHVRLVYADGRDGHPPNAPYDSIIAAAGGDELPQSWLSQLAVGGRLVAPTRRKALGRPDAQVLMIIDRTADGWRRQEAEAVHFVPLESGVK